jgi:tetratricopeptide (TPR) repeat protein
VELEARLAKARPIVPTLEPDAAERERLQQLGYLVSPGTPLEGVLGRVGGPDPKDQMGLIRALTEGMRLNRLRRFSEALERVEALDAGGPAVELLRADLAHAAGEFEAAERYARAAIALARQRPDGYHVLGSALEAQGRLDEAWAAFQEAARHDEASGEPLVGLGRVSEARGERARAAQLYEQAAARRGASAEALWRRAALYLEEGARGEAEALLAKVAPEVLGSPDPTLRLAEAEAKAGRRERARERLERALRISPNDARLRGALEELGGEAPSASAGPG